LRVNSRALLSRLCRFAFCIVLCNSIRILFTFEVFVEKKLRRLALRAEGVIRSNNVVNILGILIPRFSLHKRRKSEGEESVSGIALCESVKRVLSLLAPQVLSGTVSMSVVHVLASNMVGAE
jgi:hypothetical protein